MATATQSRIRQAVTEVKRVWAELDYAQRRLFEIRTGVPVINRDQRVRTARTVEELDSLYGLGEDELAA